MFNWNKEKLFFLNLVLKIRLLFVLLYTCFEVLHCTGHRLEQYNSKKRTLFKTESEITENETFHSMSVNRKISLDF